jgi:hypothetical protein
MTTVYLRVDTTTGEVTALDGPPGTQPEVDPVAGFAAWLDDLDADEVYRRAMHGASMKSNPTRRVLDTVAAMLRGDR